jgi:hypothetical protein
LNPFFDLELLKRLNPTNIVKIRIIPIIVFLSILSL